MIYFCKNQIIARLLISLVFTILPGITYSIGLGQIKLYSYLDEPLDAEIEIIAAEEVGADRLLASIASTEDFQRAGLSRPYILSKLRLEIKTIQERTFVKVTSLEPIKQASLEFITDLTWPGGKLVRGYTILLDPASMGTLEKRPQYENINQHPNEKMVLPDVKEGSKNYESLFEEPSVKKEATPAPKAPPVTVIENTENDKGSSTETSPTPTSPTPQPQSTPKESLEHSKLKPMPPTQTIQPVSFQRNSLFLVSGLALLAAVTFTILVLKRFRFSTKTQKIFKKEDFLAPLTVETVIEEENPFSMETYETNLHETNLKDKPLFEEEMPLKFNLARQYLDILDIHAAKEILDEIIARGSEKEQEEAITLLSTLPNISSKS